MSTKPMKSRVRGVLDLRAPCSSFHSLATSSCLQTEPPVLPLLLLPLLVMALL